MSVRKRVVVGVVVLALTAAAAGCGGGSSGSAGPGGSRNAAGQSTRRPQGDGPPARVILKNDTGTDVTVGDAKRLYGNGWTVPAHGSSDEPIVQANAIYRLGPGSQFFECGTVCAPSLLWESFKDGRVTVGVTNNENTFQTDEVTVSREGETKVVGTGRLRFRVRRVYPEMGTGFPQLELTVIEP